LLTQRDYDAVRHPEAVNSSGSRWRPTPPQLVQVLIGLWIFGTGEALVVASELGNSPWTVLAEGVSLHTPLSIGAATFGIGVLVLLCWIPLRERPGLGTVLNGIIIGVAIDATLAVLPAVTGLGLRWASLLGGIALVGVGSGLYLTAALGPGPRDGIMTGLNRRFGWPLFAVRTCIELTAVTAGVLLDGTAGIGSLLFALLVGPAVGLAVRVWEPRAARGRVSLVQPEAH
jgi:uncharacterized membrane protein YczE